LNETPMVAVASILARFAAPRGKHKRSLRS
jgi:hypothetical protein